MYSLLIIDDQNDSENRKSIYKFMFENNFQITCTDSDEMNLEDVLNQKLYDCVILDNNLDKGLEKNEVLSLLAEYGYPIIMVSNVRKFTLKENMQNQIIDFISLNQYFALRDLQEHLTGDQRKEKELIEKSLESLHERVNCDIFRACNYEGGGEGKIVIGHISDIQFGDPGVEENALRTLFNKLEEFIINRDSPIDILVISGDIVFSGKKTEFDTAEQVIEKFMNKLKRQRKSLEIMFVPGNHDFDYQCYWLKEKERCVVDTTAMANLLKGIKDSDEKNLFENKITPDLFKDFEADSIFLYNFQEFAFKLTKDRNYLNSNFHIVNKRHLKRGLALIGVNNAYKYHKNLDNTKRYIYELDSDVVNEIKNPLFSVAVGHIDPRSLGYKTICSVQGDRCNDTLFRHECNVKGQCEKWGDMERLFLRSQSIMYLSGHKHCSDIEISHSQNILFVGAASPTGANPCEKSMNIIEIEKKEGEINARISLHRANPEKIAFLQLQDYIYDIKTSKWTQVQNT